MSHALDFLIAMVMVFLTFSIMVSGATEVWNNRYGKRGQFLWMGVARMVGGSPEAKRIVEELRAHPSIRALSRDDTERRAASYIPSAVFAAALVDVVLVRSAGVRLDKYGLPEAIALLPENLPLKRSLLLALGRSQGDDTRFREAVGRLYDECMDRVSGWYKRDAQVRGFWLGLVMAAMLNVDAVHIAMALWQDQKMAREVADQGPTLAARASAANLSANTQPNIQPAPQGDPPTTIALTGNSPKVSLPQELPVGWPARWYSEILQGAQLWWHVAATILGVLLMAGSTVVGAPFWYQLLNTLLPLRAAGKVPPHTEPPRAGPAPGSGEPPASPKVSARDVPASRSGAGASWENELERVVVEQSGVAEVQKALGVSESGLLDEPTRIAIRKLQVSKGYASTGQLTQLLLRDLGFGDRFGR